MPRFYIFPSFMLAAAVVAGCSSGSSTPGGDTVVQLSFGTESETESSNGQPFANEIALVNGAPAPGEGFDDAGQVLLVTRSTDGTSDEIVINLSNANYSIDRGENPDGGADGSFNLEINGETLEFTATPGSFFPLVATGGDGTNYELRPNTGSVFSSTNLISIIGGDDEGPFGLYTFGFETNPANLPTDGSVNYAGELAGETFSDGEASSITGSVRFTARFGDSRILGDASVTGGDGTFEFDILETNIVGNGFTTTTTLTNCPDGIVCAPSATQIGGTFFGPDGSEISGLAVIDETIAGDRIVGAAGYTATRQTD